MDISNIYGPLFDKSEIVFAAGNYNSVHALLSTSINNTLSIIPLSEKNFDVNNVLVLTLIYEDNGLIFKASNDYYLGVNINNDIATASLTKQKTLFTFEYSSVDVDPSKEYLSGTLYSLSTKVNNISYTVNWKINGFSDGDLVIMLPLSWYENNNGVCEYYSGINSLLPKLNQFYFKGYSALSWCENLHSFINCTDNELCGSCIGKCNDGNICIPVFSNSPISSSSFVCSSVSTISSSNSSSSTDSSSNSSQSSSYSAVLYIILIILIFLLIGYVYYFS